MKFDLSIELDSDLYYAVIGDIDFTRSDDPINITALKFPPGSSDKDFGEELEEHELRLLWMQIKYRVELYLENRSLCEGKALIN